MINKRLIGTVSESKKYIAGNVALQWCSLVANIVMMTAVARLLAGLFRGTVESGDISVSDVLRHMPEDMRKPFQKLETDMTARVAFELKSPWLLTDSVVAFA